MCIVCGCGTSSVEEKSALGMKHDQHHSHGVVHAHVDGHAQGHDHFHQVEHGNNANVASVASIDFGTGAAGLSISGVSEARLIRMERDVRSRNDEHARRNRSRLAETGTLALNLLSSPGSGKTSLLVRTIYALKDRFSISVIEGDQRTSNDADRIRATGAPAVQINTGKGCHLDAHMVEHGISRLNPENGGILFIENVGNLVCPASFDLGEESKIVVLSVTEGEDKPLKYPEAFAAAELLLLNKADLLPHLDFDVGLCLANALKINPDLQTLVVSAKTGEGLPAFHAWLEGRSARAASAQSRPAKAEK